MSTTIEAGVFSWEREIWIEKLSFKDRACRVQEDSQYTEHDLLNAIEIYVES